MISETSGMLDRQAGASYVVRFDDLCETSDWSIWDRIEDALVSLDIHPIVGVIPDNRDPSLMISASHGGFWERVKEWQRRGWTIALHGYQHLYVTSDRGLYGWDDRSEFAGLPFHEQERKLRRGLERFAARGVRADAWMAPNHSFDAVTLQALKLLGITTISDGLGLYPYRDASGFTWVPVQLWDFLPRPAGVWTVCLHPNRWGKADLQRFLTQLERFAPKVTSLPDALTRHSGRRRTWLDSAFSTQRRARRFVDGLVHL